MPFEMKWPFPPMENVSQSWVIKSRVTMAAVGLSLKIWADWFNTFHVINRQTLTDAVNNRPKHQPLITVSNHTSCIDDPMLWAAALTWRNLINHPSRGMRWVQTAADIAFTRPLHTIFFSLGQSYPIHRGGGVYQHAMESSLATLDVGSWIHVFPEGKVNMTNEFLRLKWGVGRLVAEAKKVPLVLPMWHVGMETVLPNHQPYIPRMGKKITFLIGEPMDLVSLVQNLKEKRASPKECRKTITDVIQEELYNLKLRAEALHFANDHVIKDNEVNVDTNNNNNKAASR